MITSLEDVVREKSKPDQLLLVDDDSGTRELMAIYSKGYNCEWTMVGTATEGIRLVTEKPFRIVILDLKLPCMLGKKAFEKLTEARPEQAIVILSGYLDMVVMRDIEKAGFAMFLSKPVSKFDRQFVEKMFNVLQVKKLPPPLDNSPSI